MRSECLYDPRCPVSRAYHDHELGVPRYDDRYLFEMLVLEATQPGLHWAEILRRREAYREALDGFDAERIARYGDARVAALMGNPALIRNRGKLSATIANARAFLAVRKEWGSFARFLWSFVDGEPLQNQWEDVEAIPSESPVSRALADAMKARGFRYVGAKTCYAYMEAVGLVNDHVTRCPRHAEIAALALAAP